MKKHLICSTSDLSLGDCKSFNLGETPCFITRNEKGVFGYVNACPHLGVTMEMQPDSFLDSDKELIQCSMHGALFVIDSGECVYGPCQGKNLQTVKVTEENGMLFAEG